MSQEIIGPKRPMRPIRLIIPVLLLITFFLMPGPHYMLATDTGTNTFQVLCYHDVRDDVQDHYDPDSMAVSTRRLIQHFAWLKGHGYHPVSIDDLIKARDGIKELPDKAVLITFDDGLKSIYTKVYPILKLFNYPAVVALMGKWLEQDNNLLVKYGHKDLTQDDFLTWEQIQELDRSSLVEFASHSYNLHRGIRANPQGNVQPAPAARVYLPESKSYEDDETYKKRIRADLEKSVRTIKKYLGKGPRVMVWPYGKYNRTTTQIACDLGMAINFTLDPKINNVHQMELVGRSLMSHNPELDQLIWELHYAERDTDPLRVVHVDLDYLYDPDKRQQAKNLDLLLERVKQMKINRVFLQAFADQDGDGTAHALYFPNRHLPVKADLFNRIAWQLKTRSEVRVYAWMPVSAFIVPSGKSVAYVTQVTHNAKPGYKRLSIFDPSARTLILEIYEDLAKHADFDGLLFHDDAYLNDFEDAGPQALKYYQDQWNLPPDINQIRQNPELFKKWSALKTRFLITFTQQIKDRVQLYRDPVKTARNIYARPIIEPKSETWFAQSYPLFLENYDFTAVMAMPYMEKAKKPKRWLTRLVKKAAALDPGLKKTLFELQARDWRTQKDIPAKILLEQMEILQLNGALNYGYYPDNFIKGRPNLEEIRKGISLQTYPYKKR